MDYQILVNYGVFIILGFMLCLFIAKKFLFALIKLKLFNNKYNVLVEVDHPVSNYYKAGKIDNGFLYFMANKRPDNPKPNRIINVPQDLDKVTFKSFGVVCIRVDDVKNCILYKDGSSYKSVPGYNAEAVDELVNTALNKPSLEDGLFSPKMFQLVVLLLFFGVGVGIYMLYKGHSNLDMHIKMVYDTVQPIYNHFNLSMTNVTMGG